MIEQENPDTNPPTPHRGFVPTWRDYLAVTWPVAFVAACFAAGVAFRTVVSR